MCTYSMIADGWRGPPLYPADPLIPNVIPYQPYNPLGIGIGGGRAGGVQAPTPNVHIHIEAPVEKEGNPNVLPDFFKPSYMPLHLITPEIASKMLKCLKLLDEIDKATGARDCKLNEKEKKQFVENLRKIAGEPCECEE